MDLIVNKTKLGHKQYGEGVLKSNDGNIIVVDFGEHGEKKFTGQSILDKQLWVIKESILDSNKPKEYNKSNTIIGNYNIQEAFISSTPLVYKESYVIIGERLSAPSILANYNLIIIGNLYCEDITINGSLTVIGNAKLKKIICGKEVVCSGKLDISDGEIESNIVANELKASKLQCNGNISIQTVLDVKDVLNTCGILLASEGIIGKGSLDAKSVVAGEFIDFDGNTPDNTFEISEIASATNKLQINNDSITEFMDSLINNKLSGNMDLSTNDKREEFLALITDVSNNDIYRNHEWKYLVNNIFAILKENKITNLRECLLTFYAEKYLPKEIKYNQEINNVFSTLLPNAIDMINDLDYSATTPYDIAFSIKVIEEYGAEITDNKSELLDKVFEFMGIKYITVKKYLTGE